MEHKFITYLRTKQLFQQRLKHQSDDSVCLHESDLKRFNVSMADIKQMEQSGLIQHTADRFRALKPGAVDLSLIRKQRATQTGLHKYMKQFLKWVDLPGSIQAPIYFETFLKCRAKYLDLFFIVDAFSGRVHTPVSSLNRDLRPFLILCGESTVSLDISQMQPTLLANVLFDHIGKNAFSGAIFEGKDIYLMLQSKAGLNSRESAKKRFFEILFSKPNNSLQKLFDGENWITWINDYKSKPDQRNPHTKEKQHSNLAYLLQSYEVRIMSEIWQNLAEAGIYFLTVHDEIICRAKDAGKVENIMNSILSKRFKAYKINIKTL